VFILQVRIVTNMNFTLVLSYVNFSVSLQPQQLYFIQLAICAGPYVCSGTIISLCNRNSFSADTVADITGNVVQGFAIVLCIRDVVARISALRQAVVSSSNQVLG
jgi:hypothetical protein